jgi:hypothetical protein
MVIQDLLISLHVLLPSVNLAATEPAAWMLCVDHAKLRRRLRLDYMPCLVSLVFFDELDRVHRHLRQLSHREQLCSGPSGRLFLE